MTATMLGVPVGKSELFVGPPPYAKTSILRTKEQRVFIACGGLAAEYHLFTARRLVDQNRNPIDTNQFLFEAEKNTSEDIKTFVDAMIELNSAPSSPFDELFGTAMTKVLPLLDIARVEKIAKALLDANYLDSAQIRNLGGRVPLSWTIKYRLARLRGHNPLGAWGMATKRSLLNR